MASSWVRIADIFLVGLGSVIVVVHVAHLAFLPLLPFPPFPFPFPFLSLSPSLPFPVCTSSLSLLSIFAFFLVAPASANDVAHFLELVGERLWPVWVVAAVEWVPAML